MVIYIQEKAKHKLSKYIYRFAKLVETVNDNRILTFLIQKKKKLAVINWSIR